MLIELFCKRLYQLKVFFFRHGHTKEDTRSGCSSMGMSADEHSPLVLLFVLIPHEHNLPGFASIGELKGFFYLRQRKGMGNNIFGP